MNRIHCIWVGFILLRGCYSIDHKHKFYHPVYKDLHTYAHIENYRQQGGIQQLLVAEQEARQIVSAARTAKLNRMKQAKDEAEEEVAKYRAHMEKEYQKTVSESTGFSGVNVKRLDEEMVKKIDHLKKQAAKVSPEVVKLLMTQVTTV
uniref:V-type proton ATPase subunit G n=2 Tax=Helianthus annuus TaxID=4232 RepID=A0A251UCM3_HELAN